MAAINQRIEQNKRIARRIPEELATGGDLDLIEELYAVDAVEHDPFGDHSGRTEIRESMEGLLAAFPDFSATVEEIIAEGDPVAMRVTLRGTHEGAFLEAEPTGRQFEVGNTVFTRLADGMVVERWVQPDTFGLLQQLGIESAPTEHR
jgi:predicted ester cyclase